MAEPKKRLTSARSGARRSHLRAERLHLTTCSHCHESVLSHRVCPNCGYFKNQDILHLAEREKQKEERRKAREEESKNE